MRTHVQCSRHKYIVPIVLLVLFFIFSQSNMVLATMILDERTVVDPNANQYKIRFYVKDQYGNNLDGFQFKVFSSYENASKALNEMKNNTIVGYQNVLTSHKGIVLSADNYQADKEYYMVCVTKKEAYQFYNTIITFRLGQNDQRLTENIRDGEHTYTIKEILSVQIKNNVRIEYKTVDDYGNPVYGIQYALFGDAAQAEAGLNFLAQYGTSKVVPNALEHIAPSDSFGTALSKKYYATGNYYLLQYVSEPTAQYELQTHVIPVTIGEDHQNLHKMSANQSDGYFYTVPVSDTQVQTKYKIQWIDDGDINGVYGLFENKEMLEKYRNANEEAGFLEKIKVKGGIGETQGFYPPGTYLVSALSDKGAKEITISLQAGDRQDVEKGYDTKLRKDYYVKNVYTSDGLYSVHKRSGSDPVRVPLAPPDRLPIRTESDFTMYKDIYENQYAVFDENAIPIGYVILGKTDDIQNYDVMRNLHPYKVDTSKTNIATAMNYDKDKAVNQRQNPETGSSIFYTIGWVVVFAGAYVYMTQRFGKRMRGVWATGKIFGQRGHWK